MRKLWARFKLWFIGILVALGIIATPFVLATPTVFTYTPATQYEDGTPLPLAEIAETRLYCTQGGSYQLVDSEAGADGDFEVDLNPGEWTCVATHVATNSIESAFSNTSVKTVLPNVPPRAPVLQ